MWKICGQFEVIEVVMPIFPMRLLHSYFHATALMLPQSYGVSLGQVRFMLMYECRASLHVFKYSSTTGFESISVLEGHENEVNKTDTVVVHF